jgi:hypothetical protein
MGYSVNTNATATANATGKSGDISGGTAFNIGGINLGTQYPSAATAGGGVAPPGTLAGLSNDLQPLLIIGGLAAVGLLFVILWKRK